MSNTKEVEREVIERLISGDEMAFREVFDHYKNRLFSFCLKLTKSEERAEEIVHDVFLKIWLHREKINPELTFSAFVFKITKNLSLNFLRKTALDSALKRKLFLEIEKADQSTMDLLTSMDYEHSLQMAMEHLPPQQRTVFKMSRIDGYTHAEIAEKLNLAKGTVKNYIILAVDNVSKFLNIKADKVLLLVLIVLL